MICINTLNIPKLKNYNYVHKQIKMHKLWHYMDTVGIKRRKTHAYPKQYA